MNCRTPAALALALLGLAAPSVAATKAIKAGKVIDSAGRVIVNAVIVVDNDRIVSVSTGAPPAGVEVIRVQTALEMREKVLANLEQADVIIKAAAVADFHLSKVPEQKMKKTAARLSLELDPTPDVQLVIEALEVGVDSVRRDAEVGRDRRLVTDFGSVPAPSSRHPGSSAHVRGAI